jgi:hypothetical protein
MTKSPEEINALQDSNRRFDEFMATERGFVRSKIEIWREADRQRAAMNEEAVQKAVRETAERCAQIANHYSPRTFIADRIIAKFLTAPDKEV